MDMTMTPKEAEKLINALNELEKMADKKKQYDGHVTIMRFTTGWKVSFGCQTMPRLR